MLELTFYIINNSANAINLNLRSYILEQNDFMFITLPAGQQLLNTDDFLLVFTFVKFSFN